MSRTHPGHSALLRAAIDRHRAGDAQAARKFCEQILRADPKHPEALHLLGLVSIERGMPEKGFQLLRRAVAYAPRSTQALNNLAVELSRSGRHDEAIPYFDKVLTLDPEAVDVHFNRARALQDSGRLDAARAGYEHVIALRADHPGALTNLAVVLQKLGRDDAALARLDAALAARPANPEAHYNRAVTLHRLRRIEEAVRGYDQAIAQRPGHAASFYNRGIALHALDRLDEALASYDAALVQKPEYPEALNNRGTVLHALFRFTQAVESFAAALALRPDDVDANFNLGNTLRALGRPEAALAQYARVLAIDPDHAGARENTGGCLLDLRRHAEAAEAFATLLALHPAREDALGRSFHARLLGCDWTAFEATSREISARLATGRRADIPFMFLAHGHDAALQRACAEMYIADKHPAARTGAPAPRRAGEEKIRIAYLSADFRDHPVSLLMAGVFEHHDRDRFEIFGITLRPSDGSEIGRRVAAAFDHFIDVSDLPDAAVAALLQDRGIDVAVDLMGHTADSRTGIFARRAAPVQVNYLGYPGTSGAGYLDYIIGDDFVVPPGAERFYTEKIARLPCFQANDDRRRADAVPTRAEAGLPAESLVFCCFNSVHKINPAVFAVWMRLLAAVPDSVLWLAADDSLARANLSRAASDHGIAPARLVFAGRVAYPAHLARLRLADLFLDTLPFNAGTTASDALWAGVPVITCAGEAFASRMAGSLLTALGLTDLVTASLAEYEALALRLALDPATRGAARARLRENREKSSLFDTQAACRHLEAAFAAMVERSRRGERPENLLVDPDATGGQGR